MLFRHVSRLTLVLLCAALGALSPVALRAQGPVGQAVDGLGIWFDIAEGTINQALGQRMIIPTRYRVVATDLVRLDALLATAPPEAQPAALNSQTILPLPLPDGTVGTFRIESAPVLAPGLAARYPQIRTYLGQGIDDPTATVRLDRTPAGFHAMILSAGETVFIDPYQRGDLVHYLSYYDRDFQKPREALPPPDVVDEGETHADDEQAASPPSERPLVPSGTQLRTYRLVVAATGEYTQFHGGTVPAALAAIVTSVNRVNGIYERELAVRLVLVQNNENVIFTDPTTDPYENNQGTVMLVQNQAVMDLLIGDLNYDVGHVFSTGGGGVASLGVPCQTGSKARGVTGSSRPVGDPFDVDYVAHEIGHQFGGRHTFNGTTNSCSGNRSAQAAYEPGSGSTIMAYAGICGQENLQRYSDAYFHTKSFDEIVAYTTTGAGNTCPVVTNTGNRPPTVDAGPNYIIPAQTPFRLSGSATDPDGDALTYAWEQFDLGNPSPPNTDDGTRPIFRSFNPTTDPTRFLPNPTRVVTSAFTLGEVLPTTNRTLTFRLTARDNRAAGGGVDYDTMAISVTVAAGPFRVTSPNLSETWVSGTTETVTWDVANTNQPPVSCPTVNITLSSDGGNSYPTTLVANTPNDGSESVTAPGLQTTLARVRVACATSIFFDSSDVNFAIANCLLPADLNNDGLVNTVDVALIAQAWERTPNDPAWDPDYDFDNNNVIDMRDIMAVASDWGEACPNRP